MAAQDLDGALVVNVKDENGALVLEGIAVSAERGEHHADRAEVRPTAHDTEAPRRQQIAVRRDGDGIDRPGHPRRDRDAIQDLAWLEGPSFAFSAQTRTTLSKPDA